MRSGSSSSPNSTRPATPLYESDFIPETSRAARAGWHSATTKSSSSRFTPRCSCLRVSKLITPASSGSRTSSRASGSVSTSIPPVSGAQPTGSPDSSADYGSGSPMPLAESSTPRPRCITQSAACYTSRMTRPPSSSASQARRNRDRSLSSSVTQLIGTISRTRPAGMDFAHPSSRSPATCPSGPPRLSRSFSRSWTIRTSIRSKDAHHECHLNRQRS